MPASWQIREDQFDPQHQHHKETIFTIGNGYLSSRGTFEERYPFDRQATLVHGLWDDIPISFTELANAPDWAALEIWVNGQRFNMAAGQITEYNRLLDLRTGTLSRSLQWSPDDGQTRVSLEWERFASLENPHIYCVQVKITPLSEAPVKIRVRANLDSQVDNENVKHWDILSQTSTAHQADLLVQTKKTKKQLGMSTRLLVFGENASKTFSDGRGCPGIQTFAEVATPQTLTVQKIVGIATSHESDTPLDLAQDKVFSASKTGYDILRENHAKAWGAFWKQSDVIIQGDPEAQIALRHALFQLRIAASQDETVSIGAKTLSGFGYKGHAFWDTEIFILPFFSYTQPQLARNMLMYRHHTLAGARRKAKANGFRGAQFSWESAETGDEVTPKFVPDFHNPGQLVRIWTGDIEVHITADIAYAIYQYWQASRDETFWLEYGLPLILETALFWGDRAEPEDGRFAIRDIIGPDEYHEHVDNNPFTNRMIQWHLDLALKSLAWLAENDPGRANLVTQQFGITPEVQAHWQNVRDNLVILQDPKTGLFEQFEGFFQLNDLDWEQFEPRTQSMQQILGIEGANQAQVIKQADVIMLLCLLRDEFEPKIWQSNWNYYNPRTDHTYGSSLGPAMQAWAACEMQQPDLAYEHFMRAARADLFDVRGNANDGIHAASAGGLWQAITFGFGGLRFEAGQPQIRPQLPAHWEKLAFQIQYRGETYQITITPTQSQIEKTE